MKRLRNSRLQAKKKVKNAVEKFFKDRLTYIYCKNSKNIKFNKTLDLEREKAKALEKSTNFARISRTTQLNNRIE